MWHLDTNIAIASLNGIPAATDNIERRLPDVYISSVVLGELLYGARASTRVELNLRRVKELSEVVGVLEFDRACAEAYGQIRAALRQKGRPTGEIDALIAAVALAHNATLVTHNTKHFENIDGLRLEDWLA